MTDTIKSGQLLFAELLNLLSDVQIYITNDTDWVWTKYNSLHELTQAFATWVERAEKQDIWVFDDLNLAFAPTGTFQTLSVTNGWGEEYIPLATRFDALYLRADKMFSLRPGSVYSPFGKSFLEKLATIWRNLTGTKPAEKRK